MWKFGIDRDMLVREVQIEVEYLAKIHGADAVRIATEKAARPHLRSFRRSVLTEAAKELARRQAGKAAAAAVAKASCAEKVDDEIIATAAGSDPSQKLARVVVVANEKGGAGKSTIAALIATTMLYRGQKVAVFDLDLRQQSLSTFFANRRTWTPTSGIAAPMPQEYKLAPDADELAADPERAMALLKQGLPMAMRSHDLVILDTPGADTPLNRYAHLQADLVVTPMNDSFIDFDLLGKVDPKTLTLLRPSIYSRIVTEARTARSARGLDLDWVVLRNRVGVAEGRNHRQIGINLKALAEQIGFRLGPSLRERVTYREIFPYGLTLADLSANLKPADIASPRTPVREEVADLIAGLGFAPVAEMAT